MKAIEVTFLLREDDPEYAEEEDNILATLDGCDPIGHENADEDYDYNDVIRFLPFRHCALFHALYDHVSPGLGWSDPLRIGSVWVEMKVVYQRNYGDVMSSVPETDWNLPTS